MRGKKTLSGLVIVTSRPATSSFSSRPAMPTGYGGWVRLDPSVAGQRLWSGIIPEEEGTLRVEGYSSFRGTAYPVGTASTGEPVRLGRPVGRCRTPDKRPRRVLVRGRPRPAHPDPPGGLSAACLRHEDPALRSDVPGRRGGGGEMAVRGGVFS